MSANPLVTSHFPGLSTAVQEKHRTEDSASPGQQGELIPGVLTDIEVRDLLVATGRAARCEDVFPFVQRLVADRIKLWGAISSRPKPANDGVVGSGAPRFDVALLDQLKRMHEELAQLRELHADTLREADELRSRVFEISGDLLTEHRSSEHAWERLTLAQRECERVAADNVQLQESLRATQAEVAAMERSREDVREQLAESQIRLERLIADSRVVCAQRDELHQDLTQVNRTHAALEQSFQKRSLQCQNLQAAIKRVVKHRRSERKRFSEMFLVQRLGGRPKAPSPRNRAQVIPLVEGQTTVRLREDLRSHELTITSQGETIRNLRQQLQDVQRVHESDVKDRAELAGALVEWLPAAQRARYQVAGCDIRTLLRLIQALRAA